MKHKKALIFSVSLVLITLTALISLFLIIGKLERKVDPLRSIGDRALELLSTNSEAEKLQFYIQESARISAEKSFQNLLDDAGILNAECGAAFDEKNVRYVKWNDETKNCFESSVYENYQQYFNAEIDKYLQKFTQINKQKIPLHNYDLFILDGKELSGIPSKPVIFGVMPPKEEKSKPPIGWYSTKPAFTISFNHDFSSFNTLKEFARQILVCAEKTNQTEKEECISTISKQSTVLMQKSDDNNFFFISPNKEFPIKFALFVPTKQELI